MKTEDLIEAFGNIGDEIFAETERKHHKKIREDFADVQIVRTDKKTSKRPYLIAAAAIILVIALPLLTTGLLNRTPNENVNVFSEETSSDTADVIQTEQTEETEPVQTDEIAASPLALLNCYIDDDGHYRVDESILEPTDDYDLFRKYFFGTWEGSSAFADSPLHDSLTIDDSLYSYTMTDNNIWYAGSFYKADDHTLVFLTGGIAGSTIHWVDMDNPLTMYISWGGVTENNWLYSQQQNDDGTEGYPVIYSLTKTDAPVNEPEENFLSIYKLFEISRDYGIDFDMLTDIEYRYEDGEDVIFYIHNNVCDFYPVYLVSEAPDKLEFTTQIGNLMMEDLENIDVKVTIEKINGEWVRTVEPLQSDTASIAADPLELLNYYIDDNGHYRADEDILEPTDDYDLFRKYFFGTWEGSFAFTFNSERKNLIIDDSLYSYTMTDNSIWYTGPFYKAGDHVLVFLTGGVAGATLHWVDMNDPQTMYIAWGGVTENNWIYSPQQNDNGTDSYPVIYSLTKTDAPVNEPEENFLSIYKLFEISRDYGIDFDMLVYIEYIYEDEDGVIFYVHNNICDFYPVYLVFEAPDMLVFKTQIGNRMMDDLENIDVRVMIEKINGEWVRTVEGY